MKTNQECINKLQRTYKRQIDTSKPRKHEAWVQFMNSQGYYPKPLKKEKSSTL